MALCTRSEVYVGLVCPGIGLSQGAADDARRQGAGLRLNTQLVVSLLSKGLWVVARWSREMRDQKNGLGGGGGFPIQICQIWPAIQQHTATQIATPGLLLSGDSASKASASNND